ncbi:hypothetical protein SPAN111604_02370 [Sphingomonas antarctica]|uniref:helix-turn-helix domain-containing protein n=1 Tax=Sphingomonas antarctica TaxID=2040274 RepID=UPI0039EB631D
MVKFKGSELVTWDADLTSEDERYVEEQMAILRPQIALMRDMRKALGLSQVETAQILGVTQSNISKIERRDDNALSDLSRLASAKGGKLKLLMEKEDGTELVFAL